MADKQDLQTETAKYGSWSSPLKAADVAEGAISRREPRVIGDFVLWAERRPAEQGRTTIVCVDLTDEQPQPIDLTNMAEADVTTRVHEYGGGAWLPLQDGALGTQAAGQAGTQNKQVPAVLGSNALADQRLCLFGQHLLTVTKPARSISTNTTECRYADPSQIPGTTTTVWVRELHVRGDSGRSDSGGSDSGGSAGGDGGDGAHQMPLNQIVSVDLDGTVKVLAAGADFYASPQPSPDGSQLAFISWNHPNMPWDHTRLHVIDLDAPDAAPGDAPDLDARDLAAADTSDADTGILLDGASLQQPRWSPRGELHVVSETDGYWDIVKVDLASTTPRQETTSRQEKASATQPLIKRPAWASNIEFGVPAWNFAEQTYDWVPVSDAAPTSGNKPNSATEPSSATATEPDSTSANNPASTSALEPDSPMWCSWVDQGVGHIGLITEGELHEVHTGFTEFGRLQATPAGNVVTIASSWTAQASVVEIAPDGSHRRLSEFTPPPLDEQSISVPQAIQFPTPQQALAQQATPQQATPQQAIAHAFYFPPTSATQQGPADELPPLLVQSHGGPTGKARSCLDLGIQYWTSRGIGVVDVNYRGSTGYGAEFRSQLNRLWGVADVDDCVAAALFLSHQDVQVDKNRLAIKGGSAGGFTTLCALADTSAFAAGLVRYGVSDLESLARDTHKFEAHYLDSLIGPWPEQADLYRQRSPLYRSESLRTPMLVLQGDDDKVVPPSQSERLVKALADAAIPHSYLLFAGEAHGFRKKENIIAALEAELSFLSQVMNFELADPIDSIGIANLG